MTDHSPVPPTAHFGRRGFLLGSAMLAASGIAMARMPSPNRPSIPAKMFDAMVPQTVGDWQFQTASGLVLPPRDALSDRLYDNLVTRSYINSLGETVMLLIAYSNRQNGVLQIHRPEICYPAGGYQLSPTRPVSIVIGPKRTIAGNAFLARGTERDEQVMYWTRVGTQFPRSWFEQRLAVARANLDQIIPDGLLARVSMIGGEQSVSMIALENFLTALNAAASPRLRSLLFGDG